MKIGKRIPFLAVLCAACLLLSCGGRDEAPPTAPPGEDGDVAGYFTDVRDAMDTLAEETNDVKTEWERKSGVSRKEWRLTEGAVDRYYRPLTKTDYYYYEDEDAPSADPLMAIFLDEWDEYRSLSASMDNGKEMTPEVRSEIDVLANEAEALLAETPPIHTDMVRRIVALRSRTLILKAGVNPEETP